jgi:hypothetical protein
VLTPLSTIFQLHRGGYTFRYNVPNIMYKAKSITDDLHGQFNLFVENNGSI